MGWEEDDARGIKEWGTLQKMMVLFALDVFKCCEN